MNTRLNHIQNWPEMAQQANWSVTKLAGLCSVSVRTMEKYFLKTIGKTPKIYLNDQRQKQAVNLLRDGNSVKGTASRLGYQHAHHFSREFKKQWGCCPTEVNPSDSKVKLRVLV